MKMHLPWAAHPAMQGRSWRPLAEGSASPWRTAFLAQYFRENAYPTTPTMAGVRTAAAKLIRYPGHDEWTELFDLAADLVERAEAGGGVGELEPAAGVDLEVAPLHRLASPREYCSLE